MVGLAIQRSSSSSGGEGAIASARCISPREDFACRRVTIIYMMAGVLSRTARKTLIRNLAARVRIALCVFIPLLSFRHMYSLSSVPAFLFF